MEPAMEWYLPSFYGDIRLKRESDMVTTVSWEKLIPMERKALEALIRKAAERKWASDVEFAEENKGLEFNAPIHTVQKFLAKQLKPKRELLDVVKFWDGGITEIVVDEDGLALKDKQPAKAVTVAKPTQGCPAPNFKAAELRAREVLFAFLTPDQQDDFDSRNAFVSTGAATGHHYMITSRHARDQLADTRRQLYDLDDRRPFCVHDYAVPAAEEMLAIHLMLQLPQHEPYLRHLE